MHISVATANLYLLPFEQVLDIIADAGFQNIELDLYWARKEWAMAQHLKDIPVKQVVRMIDRSGLRIHSIHDGGGVLEDTSSISGFVNPMLDQYLNEMGYAPDCLVFHTPHIEGDPGIEWWNQISDKIVASLEKFQNACSFITIENMPFFDGYFVPLTTPEALRAFVNENRLSVTLDTTHYAQIGIDIVDAARELDRNVKTIHLSDFKAGKTHVFIGEGELDFTSFFHALDRQSINAITLECSLSSIENLNHEMSYTELVNRLKEARKRVENILA